MIRSIVNKIQDSSGHGTSYHSDEDSVKLMNTVMDKLNASNHGSSYFISAEKGPSKSYDASETEYPSESWEDNAKIKEAGAPDKATGIVTSIKAVFGKIPLRMSGKSISQPGPVPAKTLHQERNERSLSLDLPRVFADDMIPDPEDKNIRSRSLTLDTDTSMNAEDEDVTETQGESEHDFDVKVIEFNAELDEEKHSSSPPKRRKKKKERRISDAGDKSPKSKKKKERRGSAKDGASAKEDAGENLRSKRSTSTRPRRRSGPSKRLSRSQSARSLKSTGSRSVRRRGSGTALIGEEGGHPAVAGASLLRSRSNSRRGLKVEKETMADKETQPMDSKKTFSRRGSLRRTSSSSRLGRRKSLGSMTNVLLNEEPSLPEATPARKPSSSKKSIRRKSLGSSINLASNKLPSSPRPFKPVSNSSKNFLQFDPTDPKASFTIQRGATSPAKLQEKTLKAVKKGMDLLSEAEQSTVLHSNTTNLSRDLAPPSLEDIPLPPPSMEEIPLPPPSMADIPLPESSEANERRSASDPDVCAKQLDLFKSILLEGHQDASTLSEDEDEFAGPRAFAAAKWLNEDRKRKVPLAEPNPAAAYQEVLRDFQDSSMLDSAMFSGTSWEI